MGEFGYHSETFDAESSLTNRLCASQYACPEECTAQSISIYTYVNIQATVKCAIYRASDRSLVGVTEARVISAGAVRWETFNFIVKPDLTAQDYILVAWGNQDARMKRQSDAGVDRWFVTDPYDGNFPATLPASDRTGKFCIYCTYSVGVAKPASSIVPLMRGMGLIDMLKRFPKFIPFMKTGIG